jgi:hypothetical protein
MTDDGAGLISSITDKITGITLTAAAGARPTWTAAGFNSAYGVLGFDGTDDVLAVNSVNAALPTGSAESWIFAVADNNLPGATTGVRHIGGYGLTTSDAARQLGRTSSSSVNRMIASTGTTTITGTSLGAFDGPHMVLAKFLPSTQLAIAMDGSALATAALGAVTTGTSWTRLGANAAPTAGQFFSGGIAEYLILSAIVQADIDRLFGWGAWAYGLVANLPAGNPYRGRPP